MSRIGRLARLGLVVPCLGLALIATVAALPTQKRLPRSLPLPIHPTLLDATFQLLGIAMGLHTDPCVPRRVGAVILSDVTKEIGIDSYRMCESE